MNRTRVTRSERALTLTELLVVILIIAAILVIAVPSFSSILYSSEAAMAESQVVAALRGGRDAALRSPSREDAAVVFAYAPAPGGGRLTMIPCVKVADFYDFPTNLPIATLREIFVPIAAAEPVQLPKHWMVRGYAPANSIGGIWYEGNNRYGQSAGRGDWVFPETGFFIPGTAGEGQYRQTFMVRFIAGSGVVASQTGVAPLLFLPSQADPPIFPNMSSTEVPELRALRLANPRRYVERVVASTRISSVQKRALLGLDSADMVVIKPVSAIGVYDETRLAAGLRARLDPDTGCLYKRHVAHQAPTFAPVTNASGSLTDNDAETGMLMNRWIEGDTNLVGGIGRREDGDEPQARLFTIDRYSGAPKRVEAQR